MRNNSYAATAMAISAAMAIPIRSRSEVASESTSFDLESEYNLIIQKRSKLSKSKRDAVVAQYERLA